jgi:hypothetical protein
MVLEHCKQMYWDNPEAREFFYTVDWDDLETAQNTYAKQLRTNGTQ